MSEGQVIAAAGAAPAGQVRAAIARAAQATGIDFDYLLAQARLESSLDPSARAATSSAAGLYQFTSGTWLDTLGRHGADHGMGWVSEVIRGGGIADPAMRAQVMGLRFDPQVSALMAAELASDNRADLTARLGREPDAAELYLAHFLGSAGAGQFLDALATDPGQSAAAILPKAAAANRAIFYEGGAARSVGSVMALMRGKVAGAMEGAIGVGRGDGGRGDGGGGEWAAAPWSASPSGFSPLSAALSAPPSAPAPSGPLAREFHAGLPDGNSVAMPARAPRSMAATLEAAFGAGSSSAPEHVRAAYAKLARLGL